LSKIKVFALGGLNENGKNMYVVNVDEEIFIFDCGLKYDNDINLGIDYIIPGHQFLIDNKDKIKGIFLSHGHESNMGATPDILEAVHDIPVYGTHLTLEILKNDMSNELIEKCNLIEIKPYNKIVFGNNSIFPISVTHSIPDAVCYVLYTPDGAIVYTGDYTFDSTMLGNYKCDIGKLAYVGKQGVLCLLSESIYASKVGHTSPLDRAASLIREVLAHNEGRIICTVFPAHFYRIQELFDEIMKTHRNVIVMGKGLQNMISESLKEGYLTFDESRIKNLESLNEKGIIVFISDEKERPFSNLNRIIKGYDKFIKLTDEDTVFITEPSYPGIEKKSSDVLDQIAQIGANGIMLSNKKSLLHHASSEDLMLMINLMNPKYYFPVKGEYKDQYANAEVAEACGMDKNNIILKLNGDVVEFDNGEMIESFEKVPVEQVLISGSSGDDIGDLVLKDREMLGNSGIVIISCTLDKDTKEIIGGPEILTRGFVYVKESQELIEKTAEIARNVILEDTKDSGKRVDYTRIKNDVRAELGNYFYQETEAKPMIITVIQEV